MRVLVTGMTGFIGSHLGRLLVARGADVIAIVRPGASTLRVDDYLRRVHVIEADLERAETYRSQLRELQPERAFHLAWYVEPQSFWNAPENLSCVSMTIGLAQVLADLGCEHVIAVGSCAEYARHPDFLSEDSTPSEPSSLYGAAKNATREAILAYGNVVDTTFAWARFFFPFGPGEPRTRLIPSVTLALLRGERAQCSHGNQIRDFIHVHDCASALFEIGETGLSGTVNVGTGEPVRLRRVVEILATLTGRGTDDLEFGAVETDPDEPAMILADVRKLRSTGWEPSHTLESGLADTVEWLRKGALS